MAERFVADADPKEAQAVLEAMARAAQVDDIYMLQELT
jgi:hypothetical protein